MIRNTRQVPLTVCLLDCRPVTAPIRFQSVSPPPPLPLNCLCSCDPPTRTLGGFACATGSSCYGLNSPWRLARDTGSTLHPCIRQRYFGRKGADSAETSWQPQSYIFRADISWRRKGLSYPLSGWCLGLGARSVSTSTRVSFVVPGTVLACYIPGLSPLIVGIALTNFFLIITSWMVHSLFCDLSPSSKPPQIQL